MQNTAAQSNSRIIYTATEQGIIDIPLSDLIDNGKLSLYPELINKNYFRIFLRGDKIVFQAAGHVGLIPINDKYSIDIQPRFPVANIERIMLLSEQKPLPLKNYHRRYSENAVQPAGVVQHLADSLISCLNELLSLGLHQQYEFCEASTSFPHGRVNLSKTIRQQYSRGIRHKVSISWFQRTQDIPVNKLLKYALFYLANRLGHHKKDASLKQLSTELNRLYNGFKAVGLDHSRYFINDPLVINPNTLPSIRQYYHDPISLSLAIIRDKGITFNKKGDNLLMVSLLLNLEVIFENYIRMILYQGIPKLNPSLVTFDGNKSPPVGAKKALFDNSPTPPATPDIVIQDSANNTPPIIVEVKYKSVEGLPDRDDINQTLTYAQCYRARFAFIVVPSSAKSKGLIQIGKIDNVILSVFYYNLAATDLKIEEEAFCQSLISSIQN